MEHHEICAPAPDLPPEDSRSEREEGKIVFDLPSGFGLEIEPHLDFERYRVILAEAVIAPLTEQYGAKELFVAS